MPIFSEWKWSEKKIWHLQMTKLPPGDEHNFHLTRIFFICEPDNNVRWPENNLNTITVELIIVKRTNDFAVALLFIFFSSIFHFSSFRPPPRF